MGWVVWGGGFVSGLAVATLLGWRLLRQCRTYAERAGWLHREAERLLAMNERVCAEAEEARAGAELVLQKAQWLTLQQEQHRFGERN